MYGNETPSDGLLTRLFSTIDVSSLVTFRIMYGLIMLGNVVSFFLNDRILTAFIEPEFFFSYLGFSGIQPWSGVEMCVHFWALALLSVLITVGLFYRVSAMLLCVGWTYVFLLHQSQYQNHHYPTFPR